jgi:PDZ domain
MKKTMGFTLAVGVVAMAMPGSAVAQAVIAAMCPAEEVRPDLGISGLDCVGECTVVFDRNGRESRWRFSVEPTIMSVREGSPADGRLRAGDRLVALDGSLITTVEGGQRYASLSTGETVRIRFRRDGRVGETSLQVGSRCRTESFSGVVGRVPPVPGAVGSAVPRPDVVTAPRVVYEAPSAPSEPSAAAGPEPATAPSGISAPSAPLAPRASMSPAGRLGAGFKCGPCGTRTDSVSGEARWFFSGPLEITNVEPGGPADRAGIQVGDLIAAVDGLAVDSEQGGAAFSTIMPGKAVSLTVVRRDGRRSQVRVVPSERAEEPMLEAPAVAAELPLRFVGSIAGVDVEVRGRPVQVSEYQGERVLIIDAGGTWIRIRVPPEVGR